MPEDLPPGLLQRILDYHWQRGELLQEGELQKHLDDYRAGKSRWNQPAKRQATAGNEATDPRQRDPDSWSWSDGKHRSIVSPGLLKVPDDPPAHEHLQILQALEAVVDHGGHLQGVEKSLAHQWINPKTGKHYHRSSIWKSLRRFRKWIEKVPIRTTDPIGKTRNVKGVLVYSMTAEGSRIWARQGHRLPIPEGNGATTPEATKQPLPDAGMEATAQQNHRFRSLPPVASRTPPDLQTFMGGIEIHLDRFEIRSEIVDRPDKIPEGWEELKKRNRKGGGMIRTHSRSWPCQKSCGCDGRGWELQLTWAKGDPHLLRVLHLRKIPGDDLEALVSDTIANGLMLLRDSAKLLGVRITDPVIQPFRIENRDPIAREILDDQIPAGCTVEVISSSTGTSITIDKSSWGRVGDADLGFGHLDDARDHALAGVRSAEALKVVKAVDSKMDRVLDQIKLQEVQGQLLDAVASNIGRIAEIQHQRELQALKKPVTER